MSIRKLTPLLALVCCLFFAGAASAQSNPCNPCGGKAANPCNPCGGKAANPCNPCGGKAHAIAINPCYAKMGKVFHFNDPMKRNTASFTSEAPLEDMVGTTNNVVGYLVMDPANLTQGVRGAFAVSVMDMTTGIPLRDEHMQSAQWLNAQSHPQITFDIESSSTPLLIRQGDGFRTYDVSLRGPFTVNGVAQQVNIPARITYLTENDKTKQKMPGNLLAIRAEFKVPLAAHKISGFEGVVGSKVSEEIGVDVSLFGSDTMASAGNPCNPCNPCGGKANNPCNPCGGKAANPCNPCGGKAKNPCNPCGGKRS